MSIRSREPGVSTRIGAFIVHVATGYGVNPSGLTAAAGLQPGALDDLDGRMPLSVEERLWEEAAAQSGDPHFGLHAAARIKPGAFDVLDYAVRTAPDLHQALDRLARYNRLLHDVATFGVQRGPTATRIEHGFGMAERAPSRHAAEFTLAALIVVASQATGRPVHARQVEFRHARVGHERDHVEVFGVSPTFEAQSSALTLNEEDLQRPLPDADPSLARIVTAHAEQLLSALQPERPSISDQVRRKLLEGLAHGAVSLRDLARSLNMSERSLQRRLEAEGAKFGDLVDEVRRELALRYVGDRRLALGEVAYLLGFSEPSPFHRAFRRWTGTTPAEARRAMSRGPSAVEV
jgi:AraC-like DNA-binding protein